MNEQTQNAAQALIKQAKFSEAEQTVTASLQGISLSEEHTELLYLLAVAQRYQKNYSGSLESLTLLLTLDKEHARGWQERGHNHLALNDLEKCQGRLSRSCSFQRSACRQLESAN